MSKRLWLAVLLMMVAGITQANAASFEITPFVGTRTSAEFDDIAAIAVDEIEINSGGSAGLNFGLNVGEDWQVELSFSRQSTDFTARGVGPAVDLGDIDVDIIHIGGLYHFKEDGETWRPFIEFSLGSTKFDPEDFESDSKFSFGLGGGAKYYFNDRLALRLQGRWVTSRINDDDELYCDPFGCFVVEDANFLNQIEFSAGLAIRIGG